MYSTGHDSYYHDGEKLRAQYQMWRHKCIFAQKRGQEPPEPNEDVQTYLRHNSSLSYASEVPVPVNCCKCGEEILRKPTAIKRSKREYGGSYCPECVKKRRSGVMREYNRERRGGENGTH